MTLNTWLKKVGKLLFNIWYGIELVNLFFMSQVEIRLCNTLIKTCYK